MNEPTLTERWANRLNSLREASPVSGELYQESMARGVAQTQDAERSLLNSLASARSASSAGSGSSVGGGDLSPDEAWIIQRESGGRTSAKNPTSSAFGLGQLLIGNRQRYAGAIGADPNTTDYGQQLQMFRNYVRDRYGDAGRARSFWQSKGWY